jgi:hypothetical protein
MRSATVWLALVLILLFAREGSATGALRGYSNVFGVDNAPGKCSQRRTPWIGSLTQTVEGPFLRYVPVKNTFRVQIWNWGAGSAGRVEFRLNGVTHRVAVKAYEASLTLDMGRALRSGVPKARNRLLVVAVNDRGRASSPSVIELQSIDPTPWLVGVVLGLCALPALRFYGVLGPESRRRESEKPVRRLPES